MLEALKAEAQRPKPKSKPKPKAGTPEPRLGKRGQEFTRAVLLLESLVNITTIIRLYQYGQEIPPVDGLCTLRLGIRPIDRPARAPSKMTPVPFFPFFLGRPITRFELFVRHGYLDRMMLRVHLNLRQVRRQHHDKERHLAVRT